MNIVLAFIVTCVLRGVGLVYALICSCGMLWEFMKRGSQVWTKQKRRQQKWPSCYESWSPDVDDCSKIEWKHLYVTARSIRFHYVTAGKFPEHLTVREIDGETTIKEHNKESLHRQPKLMLCLHGFPESWFSWRYILKSFDDNSKVKNSDGDETEYFVVAVDMRGYGQSDHLPGISSYHRIELAADIKSIVNALGYQTCILVGHDWGGVVSWQVVESYPEVIERLILLNCPHPEAGVKTAMRNPIQLILNSWYMYLFTLPKFPEIFFSFDDYKFLKSIFEDKKGGIQSPQRQVKPEELDLMKLSMEGKSTECSINYYRALLLPFYQPASNGLVKHKSEDATFPILLLWGTADIYMDKQMPILTKDYLPNPKDGQPTSRVILISGASHWLQQDRPDAVDENIREFLAK